MSTLPVAASGVGDYVTRPGYGDSPTEASIGLVVYYNVDENSLTVQWLIQPSEYRIWDSYFIRGSSYIRPATEAERARAILVQLTKFCEE